MKDFAKNLLIALFIFFLFFLSLNTYFDKKLAEKTKIEKQSNDTKIEDIEKKIKKIMYLTGKFNPAKMEDFSPVPEKYKTQNTNMYLRKEVLMAFIKMSEAAEKAQVNIKIASSTRNFNYQKNIWENKWNGKTLVDGVSLLQTIKDEELRFKKILEYSAAPGTSRHHWGTDIDINGITPGYFYTKEGKDSYDWLVTNAPLFGFCQTYTGKNMKNSGYNEERWHWSYIPTAKIFLQEYKDLVKEEDINGFLGDRYVKDLDLINNYVLNINPECL